MAQTEPSGGFLGPFGSQDLKMFKMSVLGVSWGNLVAKARKYLIELSGSFLAVSWELPGASEQLLGNFWEFLGQCFFLQRSLEVKSCSF